MQHPNLFFSGKKKLQWLEVENVDTASLTHTHSQTVKNPSPSFQPARIQYQYHVAKVHQRWAWDPGSIFLISSKGQDAFYNKAPQLNPVPPPLPQTSHSTRHRPKDRKASSSLSWEERAFFFFLSKSIFLFSKMADIMVFYEVSDYLAH